MSDLMFQARGISNWSAIILTAIALGAVLFDVRHNLYRVITARTAAIVSLFLWYLMEGLTLSRDLQDFNQSQYDFGVITCGIALVSFLGGYHLIGGLPLFDDFGRRVVAFDRPRALWSVILLGFAIGFLPLIYVADFDIAKLFDGLFGIRKRWTGVLARGAYGDFRSMLIEMQVFLKAVFPLAVVLLFCRGATVPQRLFCAGLILWMVLQAFSSGFRSALLLLIMPIAAAIFWKATPIWRKRLLMFGTPAAFAGGLALAVFIQENRAEGSMSVSAAAEAQSTGFEMFHELLFIQERWSGLGGEPLLKGRSYLANLVNPIPRYFWPNKPGDNAGYVLAEAHGYVTPDGITYVSIAPGVLGEMVMNFGLIGVPIVSFLIGVILRSWDRLLPLASQSFLMMAVFGSGLAMIFVCGRSLSMPFFYGLIGLYILLVLLDRSGVARRRAPQRNLRQGADDLAPAMETDLMTEEQLSGSSTDSQTGPAFSASRGAIL
jgi:hypothetical protein